MATILPATERDIPAIISMAERTWWSTYSTILPSEQIRYMLDAIYGEETLRSHMKQGTQRFLILKADGKPQAFAAFGARPDPKVYKIHKLYVLPENQGKGYGRQLIDAIRADAGRNGVRHIDLNVNRYNPARHFYEKYGFAVIGEEDVPIGPYWMNDYVMRMSC